MNFSLEKIDDRLQRIANVLILNTSCLNNLGLLNGKLGISIFFYHYARYTKNEVYETFAGELIDEIYDEIHQKFPVDFVNGLTGIGWGVEYLVKNGFIDADTDDVLEEIDRAVFVNRLQRPILLNNCDEMFGYGLYYLVRLSGKEQDDNNLQTLIKKDSLIYLVDECERLLIHQKYLDFKISELSTNTINSLVYFLLEMVKLNLFPIKVEKIIKNIISNIVLVLNNKTDFIGNEVLIQLIEKISETMTDKNCRYSYQELIKNHSKKLDLESNEWIINEFTKTIWNTILYPVTFSGSVYSPLTQKAIEIAIDNDYWTEKLISLNKTNFGLNEGLAGLGLGLLNEGNRLMR